MRQSHRNPQVKKLQPSFKLIFRGIYYRHEFARRDDGPLIFTADDITDLPSFVAKLKKKSNPASDFLRNHLSDNARQYLDAYTGYASKPEPLQTILVQELNTIIQKQTLYTEPQFSKITLRPETEQRRKRNEHRKKETRLNRMFLEDAYRPSLKQTIGVCAASESLMKQLGIPPERAHQFLGGDGRFLTTEIITRFNNLSPKQATIKTALRDFFKTYGVLPMTGDRFTIMQQPFFPMICNSPESFLPEYQFKQLWKIWDALLTFESFCITVLQVGTPLFFPMFPINRLENSTVDLAGTGEINKMLTLAKSSYPFLTHLELPTQLLDAYCDAFRFQVEVTEKHEAQIRPEKPSEAMPNWHRIPWAQFDWILKVYDFSKTRPASGKLANEYEEFFKREEQRGSAPRKSSKPPKVFKKEDEYVEKLRIFGVRYYDYMARAREWIAKYREII